MTVEPEANEATKATWGRAFLTALQPRPDVVAGVAQHLVQAPATIGRLELDEDVGSGAVRGELIADRDPPVAGVTPRLTIRSG